MDQVITKHKDDALTLRWLQQATAQDDGRPVLSGVCKSNGRAVSADGYRMHIAPTPRPLQDLEDDTIIKIREGKTLHKTAGRVYPAEEIEGVFPDWESIVPKDDPNMVIAFNPEYLREALELPQPEGSTEMVVLKLYNSCEPIVVQDQDGTHQAVVMPMYLGDKDTDLGDQARACDKRLTQAEHNRDAEARLAWIRTHYPEVYEEATEAV